MISSQNELLGPHLHPRVFWWIFGITCALKATLAATVPITGDEAYFALWGMYPDIGYYDHPPMVGWWLWCMLLGGNSTFLVRLPAMLVPLAAALLVRGVLRRIDAGKADLVATIFLLTPFNALGVITTTDTPLVFFSALSAVFAYQAYLRGRWWCALLAGLFLGCAFLSKYFAVLLGIGYAVLFLGTGGIRRGSGTVLLILLGALPAIAVNIVWNYQQGWTNIMFNVFNRHGGAGFSLVNPLTFLLMTAFWLGPGILFGLFKARTSLRHGYAARLQAATADGTIVFFAAALVPAAIFFLLSWVKSVGFHWLMSYFPLFFPVLFALLDVPQLRRMLKPTAWFSGVLGAVTLVTVQLPLEWFRSVNSYESVVLAAKPEVVLESLRPWLGDHVLATTSYAKSSVLEFMTGGRVPVLGRGSFNGRHDDVLTDFRELDGRDILLLDTRERRVAVGAAWFADSELRTIEAGGGRFVVLIGRGFRYDAYRRDVLQRIADDFYQIPPFLAGMMRSSFFLERYDLTPRERDQ